MQKVNTAKKSFEISEVCGSFVKTVKENAALKFISRVLFRVFMGFLLSRAVVFGEYAPFGTALVAAYGGLPGALETTVGAFLGYIFSKA